MMNEISLPSWILSMFGKVKKEISNMPFSKFKKECEEAFFKIANDPSITKNDWMFFWNEVKKHGIDINDTTVKSFIKNKLKDKREEALFNMEQELGIPSNLRYHNRNKNESIDNKLDEDAKHWWDLIKQEAFPTLAFYPALQVWLEFDKMLKGTEYSGKVVAFYAAFWLFLVSGKYIKSWIDWKKENPEQHAKEAEAGGGGII
jgi:hypothetical protein